MVQKDGNWQWLLEGFKFDLEAQVRPRTVEYYCDLARIFVQWVESAGIDKPELLAKRDINRFFHYITHESPTAKQSNNSGEGLTALNLFGSTITVASRGSVLG